MRTFSNKKILIGFSDPGGAKPLLAFAEQNRFQDLIIVSDREYPFYKDFLSKVTTVQLIDLPEIVEAFKPDEIITGTSYPSLFEKDLLSIALNKRIHCTAYIDHYTRINDRFLLENGAFIQPDEVWVIDEKAKKIATNSLLKEDKITISGNPYHQWLRSWKPSLSKESFFTKNKLNIDNNKKIILFAPDPLSNINGIEKYGFDELTVLEELVEIIESAQVNLNMTLLIKSHPNQNLSKLRTIIKGIEKIILLPLEVDTNSVIFYSDIVIGFFSSILVEANILKKPIIKYLPVTLNEDPLDWLSNCLVVNKNNFTKIINTYGLQD